MITIKMMDYFFIGIAAILGVVIVREDMTIGKIRNVLIAAGMIAGFSLYGIIFAWSLAARFDIISESGSPLPLSYFPDILSNFLISVLCGYLLWHYKLWAAGDAKFFMLLSFLVPLRFYENGYLPYFPSSALVINIFIPIFLLLLARIFVDIAVNFRKFAIDEAGAMKVRYKKVRHELESVMEHKKRILIFSGTFLLTFLFIPLLKYQTILALSPSFSVVLLIFIVFYFLQSQSYKIVTAFLKKKWFVSGVSLFIVSYFGLGFFYFIDLLLTALIMTVKVGATFFIILAVLERFSTFYIKRKEIIVVKANDLKQKMIISEELVKNIQNDEEFSKTLGELYPEGISEAQTTMLKEWFLKHNKLDVPVYKTFSFAPYIFAGAIITIVLKQSAVHLFLSFIR